MTPKEKLLWDMKVTAGSRFIAATRLSSKDKIANISIAIYSAIVVSTSFVTLVFDIGSLPSKMVSVGTLMASIIILVMSMKLFADRHAVESEQMHRCALEINELRRVLIVKENSNEQDLIDTTNQYNLILQKYSINHSNADFMQYKFSHKWEFEDLRALDDKKLKVRKPFRLGANLAEKITAMLGGAGLAAAIASLISAISSL